LRGLRPGPPFPNGGAVPKPPFASLYSDPAYGRVSYMFC
jgi:hypothetical protein